MYSQQPHDEPLYQPPPQVVYRPPPKRPKRTTMKVLAIVFLSVGLGLALLATMPRYGPGFGLLWFVFDVLALIFLCLI